MGHDDQKVTEYTKTFKYFFVYPYFYEVELAQFKWSVRHNEIDVHWRDPTGLNALMYTAIAGSSGKPRIKAFNFLLRQNEQPLKAEEKVEGLEILGSTYILDGLYKQGLECWKKAYDHRSGPRDSTPVGTPNLVLNSVRPEWSVYSDLAEIETDYLNLVNQAFLVRQRLCSTQCAESLPSLMGRFQYGKDHDFIKTHFDRQYVLLLIEWDAFYVPSLNMEHYFRRSFFFSSAVSYFIRKDNVHETSSAILMTLLKWITAIIERHPDNAVMPGLIGLIRHLCDEKRPLDGIQSAELKNCLKRLVASYSPWCNKYSMNLLVELCESLKYHYSPADLLRGNTRTAYSNDTYLLNVERVVHLLIEAGIDVNHKNYFGKTALHLLLEKRTPEYVGLIQLLLDNGARWDIQNHERKRAVDYAIFKEAVTPMISLPTSSLKSLCMRVLRQNYVKLHTGIKAKLPDALKRLVKNRQAVMNEMSFKLQF